MNFTENQFEENENKGMEAPFTAEMAQPEKPERVEDNDPPKIESPEEKNNRLISSVLNFMQTNDITKTLEQLELLKGAIRKVYEADMGFSNRLVFMENPLCWLYIVKNQFKNNKTTYVFKFDGLPEPLVYEKESEIRKLRSEALKHGIVIQNNILEKAFNDVFDKQEEYDKHIVSLMESPLKIHQAAFKVYKRIKELFKCEADFITSSDAEYNETKHLVMRWKNKGKEDTICLTEDVFNALINCCPIDGRFDTMNIKEIMNDIKAILNGEMIADDYYDADDILTAKQLLRDCGCIHMRNGVHFKTMITYVKSGNATANTILLGKKEFLVFKMSNNI